MHGVLLYAPAAHHKSILFPAFTMLCLIHECDIWHVPELQRNQRFQRQRQPSFFEWFHPVDNYVLVFFSRDITLWASLGCRPKETWTSIPFLGGLIEFRFWIVYRWLAHNEGWETVSLGWGAIFRLVSFLALTIIQNNKSTSSHTKYFHKHLSLQTLYYTTKLT